MNYPLPRNHFRVEWAGTRIDFCEVSGLSIELSAPAFRDGSSADNSKVTMPGQIQYPHLVLKRPVVKGDNEFFKWISSAKFNQIQRRDIVVSLLNELHEAAVVWTFKHAFPVKVNYSTLEAASSEPMMEIIEITHEGMVVENN